MANETAKGKTCQPSTTYQSTQPLNPQRQAVRICFFVRRNLRFGRQERTDVGRRELPSLGSDSVHLAQGKLFAKTASTLYALEPRTGTTIWSFCPYSDSGEMIYSHPTLHGKNLFIGDRCGYLHCLDSRTGKPKWKVLTNTEKNSDVNSTPVVTKGLVICRDECKSRGGVCRKKWQTGLGAKAMGRQALGHFFSADS